MGDRAIEEVLDDRYEVKEVAGEGGMGRVLRVLHRQWGIDLAVKTPKPEVFATDEQRERFVTEAEAWVALGLHPNICGCHYVRVVDGVPYVFAEYVGAYQGLGIWMSESKSAFRTDLVFGAIGICALVSVTLFMLIAVLARVVMPWYYAARRSS